MNPLLLKVKGRVQRDASRLLARRPVRITPSRAIVSFTFDDFPRSALHEAGAILRSFGFLGTYYASFGLMGTVAPTGPIFCQEDLAEFVREGHELGCHTYDHYHSWDTPPQEFEASVLRNKRAAQELLQGTELRTFSYPISGPRPQTKRNMAKYFDCARGGGQTFNGPVADLNCLKAFFIEQSRNNVDAIKKTIDANVREGGWLIFATHDVCQSPTPFGCIPRLFGQVVEYAANSGAQVLPVHEAWRRIQS